MESANKMHIIHYTNVYKPMRNGVVTSVESFRQGQLEQGHEVYVVAPTPGDKSYQQERFVFNIAAVTLPAQSYPFVLPYDPTISRVLRGIQADILHTHHPVGLGRYARLGSQRLNLPLVFTFHTWYEDFAHYISRYIPFVSEDHVAKLIRFWIRRFLKQCHHVVAPSQTTRSRILQAFGDVLPEENLSVVPTGIDTDTFSRYGKEEARARLGWSAGDKYLVSCGRLSREKKFDVLVDAVSRMEEDSKLVILGDGDLRSELEKQVRELGLESRVSLPGNVDREVVARYFAAADLFAFASPNETQGLVVLEAMAAGTPPVVVGEGGVTDFVRDNVNGVITENHPEALARALDRTLRIDDLSLLRQRGRETALDLSVKSQVNRISEVYAKAKRNSKTQPAPGLLSSSRVPPLDSTINFAIQRPSPEPFISPLA